MNRNATSALALLLVLTAAGCADTRQAVAPLEATGFSRAYHHASNVPSHGVALEGYCPVAYFAVGKPVRGKSEHAATHEGITYHFVSAEAKTEFMKQPTKYAPAYGGWCAFGMAVEDKFPVDPTQFKIVNGRLMLFLRNDGVDALDLWNAGDEQELLRKADAHWRRVRG
ncbi:MAG: YHS domain-containing (seleno)protein [Planctomycetota bacterium]